MKMYPNRAEVIRVALRDLLKVELRHIAKKKEWAILSNFFILFLYS